MSEIVILDTSVLVDNLRTGRHGRRIESISGLIRTCSVVLAELWRGARRQSEREFLQILERNHPVLNPTSRNWIESAQILGRIGQENGVSPAKLRDLHFDVLIALSARSYGAKLITSNGYDFELINRYRRFQLETW